MPSRAKTTAYLPTSRFVTEESLAALKKRQAKSDPAQAEWGVSIVVELLVDLLRHRDGLGVLGAKDRHADEVGLVGGVDRALLERSAALFTHSAAKGYTGVQ